MAKEKACKLCNTIFEKGATCPKCGSNETTDMFKGRIVILDPQNSEIAQNLSISEKGTFAIKTS